MDVYVYGSADYAFALFLATVVPSDFSEYEWRVYQSARRNIQTAVPIRRSSAA